MKVSHAGSIKCSTVRRRPSSWPQSDRFSPAETESETLNRAILASLPGVVLLVDRAGKVIRADPRASTTEDTLRALACAVVGSDYSACWISDESCGSEEASKVLEAVRTVADGLEAERSVEYQYRTVDGDHWLDIRADRLDRPEGGAVVTHFDITARKRAEMLARQELEAVYHSNRVGAMGRLAASLAHEVSQPLAAILSNAEATLRYLDGPSPDVEEIREVLVDIADDAQRADSIIRNIRRLLKKREIALSPISVNSAVADAAKLITHRAQMQQVRLDIDLSPNLPFVRADHVQLEQVVLNLAANGIDAMESDLPDRRILSIRTSLGDRTRDIVIEVSDLGKGIAEEDLVSVFEPFRSSKTDGLGMGLAISRSIVETAGGRIRAERRPGGGMSFFVMLPAVDRSLSGSAGE